MLVWLLLLCFALGGYGRYICDVCIQVGDNNAEVFRLQAEQAEIGVDGCELSVHLTDLVDGTGQDADTQNTHALLHQKVGEQVARFIN